MCPSHTQLKLCVLDQYRFRLAAATFACLFFAALPQFLAAKQEQTKPQCSMSMIAEWEPATAIMIAWPLRVPDELVTELATAGKLFVLMRPAEMEAAKLHIGQLTGVDRVRYIPCSIESEWTRDWGPHQVFDKNGTLRFVDHKFDGYPWYPRLGGKPARVFRTGPGDDHVSAELAAALKMPIVDFPAVLTGGNFLVDGHGTAFCTQALFDENMPVYDEASLRKLVQEKLGVDRVVLLENTEQVGIQHIDCWLKVLDPERLLVKRSPQAIQKQWFWNAMLRYWLL